MPCLLNVLQRYSCDYCSFEAHRQSDLTKHIHTHHDPTAIASLDQGVVRTIGKKWKKEDMDQAVEFYTNQELLGYKVSIRQVAERYNVPKSTLNYQVLSLTRSNLKPELRPNRFGPFFY